MGKKRYIDSSILDKAIVFATEAHKNTERIDKGFPYIVHILETVSIIATMTNDQELLAAGALHDTVEDCDITIETIEKEFGKRIEEIVKNETDTYFPNKSKEESWKKRKEITLHKLLNASFDTKIVALGDKLSNIRAIALDFDNIGIEVFNKFTAKDPNEIKWYYTGLAKSLSELKDFAAYKEFVFLIEHVFQKINSEFNIKIDNSIVFLAGKLDRENSQIVENQLTKGKDYILDFSEVTSINFAGIRTLLRMRENGITFSIVNAKKEIAYKLYTTSLNKYIALTEEPKEIFLSDFDRSGEGFTSISYFRKDNDSMLKLYCQDNSLKDIQIEKRKAEDAFKLGIPTPIVGSIVKHDNKYGIIFERIMNKKSFARMLADDSCRSDELAEIMANVGRELHNTKCDVKIFPNEKELMRKALSYFTPFSREETIKVSKFIDSINDTTTCLHGDFHIGNLVMTDKKEVLFIDMGDFAYGDPRFDLACLYFNMYNPLKDAGPKLFHCEVPVLKQFWRDFIKHYYNLSSEKEIDNITNEIEKFAGLIVIYYAMRIRVEPWMNDLVHKLLIEKL